MSRPSDRTTLTKTTMPPAALRRDGTAPRSLAERLRMLVILAAICLAIMIPVVVVTGIFGQRPKPKVPPQTQAAPEPGGNLRAVLRQSADTLLPGPAALTPESINLTVRPGHVAARAEKIARQAAQFGGTSTEGVADGEEKHLFVDLPATASAAFRLAVTANTPVAASASPAPAVTVEQDHVEVFIRPTGNDE